MLKRSKGVSGYLYTLNNSRLIMNYLAHAYLSFNLPEILVGNMINDFVKGKKQYDYPEAIQKGIQLHRAIDAFTDNHAATKKLKSFFHPHYRLYAGAFADVVYDYFLANDPNEFASENELEKFAANTYRILETNDLLLPEKFRQMLPYMKAQDWLYHYRYASGIQKSFGGLVRRATYLKESAIAFELFNQYLPEMQACYQQFFPDLKKASYTKLQHLLNT